MDRNLLLATTRSEFLRAFLVAIEAAVPRTIAALFRAADSARSAVDQRRMMGAHQLLRAHESTLGEPMRRSMEQLLNRSFQTTYSTFRPSFFSSYSGSDLALLDANLYEDQLHINELTAVFRNAAEEQLRDLNIRVAILFEQDTINERENPFRPFLFARAITSASDSLGPFSELSSALADQLAAELTVSIAGIYTRVNVHLADHGIGAHLQLKIRKSPEVAVATSAKVDQPDNARSAAGLYDDGQRSLSNNLPKRGVERLFDLVMAIAPSPGDADHLDNRLAVAPGSATSPNAWGGRQGMVNALQKLLYGPALTAPRQLGDRLGRSLEQIMQASSSSAQAAAAGPVRNLIFEQRAALNQATGDLDEQMTIDVVAMLFEFILCDSQIPAEVRAQLGRLQFLVLKIALRERSLLTQKGHPARMLVNRIGSVSIGLRQLDPSGARVSAEICRIVETLLADPSESSVPFESMLDQFDTFIAQELRAGDSNVELAVQALENAQSRTLRFARLTAQLAEALNGLTIDPFLHDFLSTSWVHVIERAERAEHTERTEQAADTAAMSLQFRQLVPDLLWSILPKHVAAERSQLLGLLPRIVATLRNGLQREGWEPNRQQVILNWLVDAHSSALRSAEPSGSGPTLSALHRHFDHFITHLERETALPAVVPSGSDAQHQNFLQEALQESKVHITLLDPLIEQAVTLPPPAPGPLSSDNSVSPIDPLSATELLERLRSGVAVEITLGSSPGIGRLNWINQDASTLVLTMHESSEPSMVSVRMFLRLLALGRVRFIETAPLFERAVQALLKSAQQVDQTA